MTPAGIFATAFMFCPRPKCVATATVSSLVFALLLGYMNVPTPSLISMQWFANLGLSRVSPRSTPHPRQGKEEEKKREGDAPEPRGR